MADRPKSARLSNSQSLSGSTRRSTLLSSPKMRRSKKNDLESLHEYATEKLSNIQQRAEEGICVLTDSFFVESINPTAQKIMGLSDQLFTGKNLFERFSIYNLDPEPELLLQPNLTAIMETGKTYRCEKAYLMRPDGIQVLISYLFSPIITSLGFRGVMWILRDVEEQHRIKLNNERKQAKEFNARTRINPNERVFEEENTIAQNDFLTGLPNRRQFEVALENALDSSKRFNVEHAMIYLDLDQFKIINDACGHVAGDQLLQEIAQLIKKNLRVRDIVARLSADEFGILLMYCNKWDAIKIGESVLKVIQDYPFVWQGVRFSIGVSGGVVPIDRKIADFSQILVQADTACYLAKDEGGNRLHIYQAEDLGVVVRYSQLNWVTEINKALADDRFQLFYQPIVPLEKDSDHSTIKHFEILVRMMDENGKLIAPGEFIAAAENYNLMPRLDEWVFQRVCQLLTEYSDRLNEFELCAINLSGQTLVNDGFKKQVVTTLKSLQIPCEKICFEITETAAIANLKTATEFIEEMKKLGCFFSLDDFGSGMASFAYLKNLPVDYLKIDGLFVKDILENPIDLAMVKSINEIGHVMGKKTIAEFVENQQIMEKLSELGLDYAQGYGIAAPAPLLKMLQKK